MSGARRVLPWLGLLALVLLPALAGKFYVELVAKIMIMAVFALSLDLLVGVTGLVSLGHAAFFGLASYVVALATPDKYAAASLWTSLPLAIAASALLALAIGALALRTRGVYFIMVTLALSQMVYFVFHDTKIGGGSDGTYLYVKPEVKLGEWSLLDLDDSTQFYYAMLGLLLLTFAFLRLLLASRFGRALSGIRSNEQRMRALGFNTYAYKLAAFTIAGAIAGIAGYFAAVQFGFINPEMLSWHQSANVLLMVILGGLGNLFGAIVGAFAFVLLQDLFSSLTKHWLLLMGGFVILAVMLLPGGLTRADETWHSWLARMRRG
ncbi:MAG TPA: branched-chain amino acid ABC transporter permease [Casimicrobiaceae bacterium]|jgi:branched-chain amino acid transport system permease protein|nr:branched-chain amino acid ABC transporter permease [Casimicrobiaceae bacterium]